jgi:hypothetical protein
MSEADTGPGHLEAFTFANLESEEPDEHAPIPVGQEPEAAADVPAERETMDRDDFFSTFVGIFAVASMAVKVPELAIQPEEMEQARSCTDAIYRLLEIHYPAALFGGNESLILALTAGSFLYGKAMLVFAVLKARAAPVVKDTEAARSKPGEKIDMDVIPFAPIQSTSMGFAA